MTGRYIISSDGNFVSEDELYHYGIIGMKWGQHKAKVYQNKINKARRVGREDVKEWKEIGKYRNKDVSKQIASSRASTNKKIAKYQNKIDKINSRNTKRTRNAVAKVSTGKAIGQSMLMGSYGTMVYNSARAKGATKGKAAAQAIINNAVNNLTFGDLSRKAKW